jgi:hypothetical protein
MTDVAVLGIVADSQGGYDQMCAAADRNIGVPIMATLPRT